MLRNPKRHVQGERDSSRPNFPKVSNRQYRLPLTSCGANKHEKSTAHPCPYFSKYFSTSCVLLFFLARHMKHASFGSNLKTDTQQKTKQITVRRRVEYCCSSHHPSQRVAKFDVPAPVQERLHRGQIPSLSRLYRTILVAQEARLSVLVVPVETQQQKRGRGYET